MTLGSQMLTRSWVPEQQRYFQGRLPGEVPHPSDDFFLDGVVASAWSAVSPASGTTAVTEGHGVMSALYSGQSTQDAGAVLRATGGLTAPVTVETCVSGGWATNIDMLGVGFTDGVVDSSNVACLLWSIPQFTIRLQTGTMTSLGDPSAAVTASLFQGDGHNQGLYLRVVWTTTNTFAANFSLDGVRWTRLNFNATYSKTMTPTHFGLFGTTWNGTTPAVGTYQYFRVYNADLSV